MRKPGMRYDLILFALLMAFLFMPLIQEHTGLIMVKPLIGAFEPTPKPELTFDSYRTNAYQTQIEKYASENFGLREPIIRIYNQYLWTTFNKTYCHFIVPGKDGYVLLGNNSMLHCEWVMTYRVTDPQKFFLTCLSTDEETSGAAQLQGEGLKGQVASLGPAKIMLKDLLNDVVISSSAVLNLESTYYDRARYEAVVKQALVDRIAAMDFGITLENLTLKIAAPPVVTLQSFQKLLLSETDAERVVEEARTYSVEQENLAKSQSAKILADAEAYKLRVVEEVSADAAYFDEIYAQYSKNREATLVSLFSDTLAEAIAPVQDKFIVDVRGGGQSVLWLKVNQEPLQQRAASAPAGANDDDGKGE